MSVPATLMPVSEALERGISMDPMDRFADMRGLLEALGYDRGIAEQAA